MRYKYIFTVFTPTYNRVSTLSRVYKSLLSQTLQDFEWIVVDDGSTDNTKEVVQTWISEGNLPIRYYYQPNSGKHIARNFAVKKAQGQFFFTWDSDDKCVPEALEKMLIQWEAIPAIKKDQFAGVAGLCARRNGTIIGTKFPEDVMDSDMFEIRERFGVTGDKCGFQRTDVMLNFPFPKFPGEKFITEALVWNRIARKYKTRFFNEVLRIVDYRDDGLSRAGIRLLLENPKGKALFFNEYMSMPATFWSKTKAGINYVRCSLHADENYNALLAKATKPIWALLGLPMGTLLYFKDCLLWSHFANRRVDA